jgi:hypothetical protein
MGAPKYVEAVLPDAEIAALPIKKILSSPHALLAVQYGGEHRRANGEGFLAAEAARPIAALYSGAVLKARWNFGRVVGLCFRRAMTKCPVATGRSQMSKTDERRPPMV